MLNQLYRSCHELAIWMLVSHQNPDRLDDPWQFLSIKWSLVMCYQVSAFLSKYLPSILRCMLVIGLKLPQSRRAVSSFSILELDTMSRKVKNYTDGFTLLFSINHWTLTWLWIVEIVNTYVKVLHQLFLSSVRRVNKFMLLTKYEKWWNILFLKFTIVVGTTVEIRVYW